jgi:hypothetical protein
LNKTPSAPYSGPDPCKHATDGKSLVAKACDRGGIKAAKALMKDIVKQGKAAGVKFDCDDCHMDEDEYDKLTDGAHEKFDKLLAVYKPKVTGGSP